MKNSPLYRLKIRLLWILRSLLRKKPEPSPDGTTKEPPLKLLRKLLIRLAEILHLIRLLISLIRRNWGGSAKN